MTKTAPIVAEERGEEERAASGGSSSAYLCSAGVELVLSGAYLCIALGSALIIVSNIFSAIYFCAVLLAANTVLLARGVHSWLLLIGGIVQVLHTSVIFVHMALTSFQPLLMCSTIFATSLSISPFPSSLRLRARRLCAAVPYLSGIVHVCCWTWLRLGGSFDVYNLDFVCICVSTILLCLNSSAVLRET